MIEINNDNKVVRICTYGTLRKGCSNYRHFLEGQSIYLGTYKTKNQFTMLGRGCGFPIVVPKGDTSIEYDLFEISDNNVLKNIHRLEGFSGIKDSPSNWYNITEIHNKKYGKCWMYIQDNSITEHLIIKSGNWFKQ